MRTRRGLVAVAAFGLLAGMAPAVTAGAAPDISDDALAFVSDEVRTQLDENGTTDVWVHLQSQADLSAAYDMSWEDRGQFVYDTLTAHADKTQSELQAQLDESGADYQSFWATNAIFVEGADSDLVDELAADPAVDTVEADFTPTAIEPVQETPSMAPQATTWGLDDIGAPTIWNEYGNTGEGITVGVFDTGVDGTHPALANSYRGAETGSDDYNWFDSHPDGSPSPIDYDTHGTHVAGTITGEDGDNQIGVAPGAQWIGSAGCCVSGADVVATWEWFLAPTPVGGGEGDPSQRPHIINNSWGYDDQFDEGLNDMLETWKAAGIFGVWASGNSGPGCDTVGSPAWNDGAYAVGNYQEGRTINESSSRGPGQDGEPGVDIAAPGTNVLSSIPGGDYAEYTGTSMASPHMAGSIALLWSEFPELEGDIDGTIAALDGAAVDEADPTCGGDDANNETWGEGRIDLPALFESLEDEPEPPALEVERYQGAHRYDTAAEISAAYGDDVDTVYVTTGQGFADALAGGAAAANGQFGALETPDGDAAPVLLVRGQDDDLSSEKFHARVKEQLGNLAPSNIVVLGGTGVVSEGIETELGDYAANVRRIGGANRYETAALLAGEFDAPETIYVARGDGDKAFADALAGSALAGRDNAPVVLVKVDEVPDATADVLADNPDANVVVLGGTAAVSDAVYNEIGAAERISGANRYQTGLAVAANYEAAETVYVATGQQYADALAGGALAGSEDVPVLLVRGTDANLDGALSAGIEEEIERLGATRVVIFGGTSAVSQGIEDDIADGVDD